MAIDKYRVHCETDNKYEYVNSATPPTACPVDPAHSIKTESTVAMGKAIADVTPRQIRLALVASGTDLATIQAGIDALPEPDKTAATVSWEYSTAIQRDNPLLIALAPALGFTDADLDNLFIVAATL